VINMPKIDEDLNNILILLEDLIGDQLIPRNLRKSLNEEKERLKKLKEKYEKKDEKETK